MSSSSYHPSLTDPNAWVPYRYIPSLPAAAIFIALFGLLTILHLYKLFSTRSWFFIPFVLGGIMEIIGYIARTISHTNLWSLGPYIIQSILLLIAPAFFAASVYMTLRRLVVLVAHSTNTPERSYTRLPPRWISRIFVIGDVCAFLLQAAGGGIQAGGTLESLKVGEDIIIVGLFVQVAFFVFFVFTMGTFHVRARREGVPSVLEGMQRGWMSYMWMLYVASLLILVRSIFRVIEYLMGNDGYLLRHEVFLYIFDATLMTICMAVVLWRYPGDIGSLVKEAKRNTIQQVHSSAGSEESGVALTQMVKR